MILRDNVEYRFMAILKWETIYIAIIVIVNSSHVRRKGQSSLYPATVPLMGLINLAINVDSHN